MAAKEKKRQKRLERQKAKRKERQKALVKHKHRGLAERLAATASAPVLDCLVSESTWGTGMGQVLISRELPNGMIAFASFLLDVYCLGVKDAFGDIVPRSTYAEKLLDRLDEQYEMVEIAPAAARKLIEGAVDYAASLGLQPHSDYNKVKTIFGDIDADACEEEFEYGSDGKPLFTAGPYDTPERCYQILSILEHTCGRDGFHYLVPFVDGVPDSLREGARMIAADENGDARDVGRYTGFEE
jgi:hypothetical protein